MKRLFAIFLICALALSGCARKPDAQTAAEGESKEPAAEQPAEAQSGELVMLEGHPDSPQWYCGSSASGSCKFEWAGTAYSDYQKLVYYDYAAATKRPVCAKEGCAHADPSCEAFSTTNESQAREIYNYGDDIVFVNSHVPLAEEPFGGEVRPVGIEVCKADGSARRTLVSYADRMEPINSFPNDGERFFEYSAEALARIEPGKGPVGIGSPLCDGRYLWYYLTEIEKGEDGLPCVKTSIVKLDYATGEQVGKVATESGGAVGVWHGKLLGIGTQSSSDTGKSHRQFTLCVYITDPDTGVRETVYSGEVNMDVDFDDHLGLIPQGGELYQIRPDEHALYRFNESFEMEKVMDVPESWRAFTFRVLGDTLLFGTWSEGKYEQYICDGFGGELRPFSPLTYSTGSAIGGDRPLPICGETEDEFFVFIDSQKIVSNPVGAYGESTGVEVYTCSYAMMKKSDYWSAKADFRDFTEIA